MTYFRDFETLLQNISDYLLAKAKWWVEEEFGVRFLDISKCSSSKKVNRFRSSSIKAEEELLKDCWQKCLDNRDKLILAYQIIVNNKDVLLKTLDFFSDQQVIEDVSNRFSNNLPNTTLNRHTSNITFESKMCVKEELSPESSLIKENKFPPLTCTGQDSDLNKILLTLSNTSITTDFTISPPAHESTSIKPIKPKRKSIGNHENIIEFKAEKPMSNIATMLQKVIGNNLLVQTYERARKKLKSMHSLENLHKYKNIVARVEVELLIINDNLNKKLKSIEHQTLKENDKLCPKPESGPNKVKYEDTFESGQNFMQGVKNLNFINIICILVCEMF